ncbi:MAG: tryptophan synthase subunit alpha [Planctomycetaceae bacterium]|nr:tryptophan synthase subunit alpha [Planctomycetaceae bacterium]
MFDQLVSVDSMSRVSEVFAAAVNAGRMTFMPFITAGDPSVEATAEVLKSLRDAQVDLIELGFPYSDPIADGPVIQASYTRALNAGVSVEKIFAMMDGLTGENLPPVLAMVSYAIIFRYGTDAFAERARRAGFSGLIVPDLPVDEADDFAATAAKHELDLVLLIAPTTTAERTRRILKSSTGFIYCVSVAGTTGVRNELPQELTDQLRSLRSMTSLPLAVGFGISRPEQVKTLEGVADGIIVGSAIVRLACESKDAASAATAVRSFSESMRAAVNAARPSL